MTIASVKHQTCKTCGRMQRFEFSVSDALWALSGADPSKAICIECWLERLDQLSEPPVITVSDFRFLGIAGDRIFAVLFEAEMHAEREWNR